MKQQTFIGFKAAFLIENGCCEREVSQSTQVLCDLGIKCNFISSISEIVKSWNEDRQNRDSDWVADYAVNSKLSHAHPSDYDILVIPGGIRSSEKLKLDKNLRTFVSGFLYTEKPVIAYNKGIDVLAHADLIKGYSVAAIDDTCENVKKVGARCAPPEFVVSKNLITLSRYRDAKEKMKKAVTCILNGESYVDKVVSDENIPPAYFAA